MRYQASDCTSRSSRSGVSRHPPPGPSCAGRHWHRPTHPRRARGEPSWIASPPERPARDPAHRGRLREVLEAAGAHVSTAQSAVDALDLLAGTTPHVLVSDIGMPGMDGLALIERIRVLPDPERSRIPALALTAYARSEDRARALERGFQVHLAKPINPSELAAAVLALASTEPTLG
ncbi:MAG: response regulator [Acidobacteria bacterium]|nr:response regulator [Acidobacteriota bacterium]